MGLCSSGEVSATMGSEPRLLLGGDLSREQSSILGEPRQRRVLSILLNQPQPMTVRDLGVQIAAHETERAPSDVPEEDHQPIRVDLHHRCLPKLEAVGWIERHPEGVIAAESLPFGDEESSFPDLQDPNYPWEAIGALLARPRRQDVVAIVAGQCHRLTLEGLATELAEYGHASWATERREDEPTLRSLLHHIDLPKLAEVGLIEYDRDEKTVTRTSSLMALVDQTDLGKR